MSCCGRKNSKFYTRPNVGKTCCNHKYDNDCCGQNNYNNGCCDKGYYNNNCCDKGYYNNSCCDKNYYNNNYYSQSYDNDYYGSDCYDDNNGLDGISCPFHNNNDCCCEKSLRDALCRLTNQRVIIHTDGCKMCVVIVSVGKCFVKTINPCTHRIVYFNIQRIDNVEDVLPRCY